MLKVYSYQGCSTCKSAIKWLRAKGIAFQELAIRETPPSVHELRTMLKAHDGQMRMLFNTSGQDYRALGLKDTLPAMSEADALNLLAGNGNLVKRPFVIESKNAVSLVGFREETWAAALQQ